MRADEEYAFFIGRSKRAGAPVVKLRRRQREAGEKVIVPVGTAIAIFHGVFVRGKEFYPLLYSRVVFCDLVEAFERLVVRTKSETGTPQVTTKALDPDDAAHFQIERGPVTFRLDGSAADDHNGANGVVILLLVEGGKETVHTGIALEEKRAGGVADGVPVRVHEYRGRGQLGEQFNSPYRAESSCNRNDHPIGSVAVQGLSAWAFSSAIPPFFAFGMTPAGEMV